MRFYAIADLHLTVKTPRCRIDKYSDTQFEKLNWIFNVVNQSREKCLVIAGDIFDRASEPYHVVKKFISLLKNYPLIKIYCVAGQHDQRFHTQGLDNTPLGIMEEFNVTILKKKNINGIDFIGESWGEKPTNTNGDILVTHKMIIEDVPLFEQQENYISAKNILRDSGFKIIISGDNHLPFACKTKNKLLINCGSVMRSSKNQRNHTPFLWQVETDGKFLKIPIPIRRKVFNVSLEEEGQEQETNKNLDDFITYVSRNENQPNFQQVLKNIIQNNPLTDEVENKINTIMETV